MSSPASSARPRRQWPFVILAFLIGAVGMAALAALLVNIQERKNEALQYPLKVTELAPGELDPAVWGRNFPRQYDSFMKTQIDGQSTPYGGSKVYSKLERYPAMLRIWAGYAFSVDHNEERGHYYAQIDQQNTKRVQVTNQPGACANCHAAEAPKLIAEMGWDNFNKTPLNDLKSKMHYGSSCADCHNPQTMELRITRPAFVNAMRERGVDVTKATRQEMRSYVCAQCHVEYYFKGDNRTLTFPWSQGFTVDDIEAHYDGYGFRDWVHKETNAQMIKIQHPEFELWSTGLHAKSGVACADCHMPYVRDGAVKISDHWLRSPQLNINNACQTCHRQSEEHLKDRIATIQDRTAKGLRSSEEALVAAIDAIVAAQKAGVGDAELAKARQYHRRASVRWDFVSSENSTGFHSPQEAMRVLADAINFARLAQIEAERVTPRSK